MTAVEWLEEELKANLKKVILEGDSELMESLFEQAKEMEKEQHQETFKQSRSANIFKENMSPAWESWEEYYNETFKSE